MQIFFLRRDLQDDEFEEMVEQSGEIDTYGVLAILSIPVWTFSLGPLTLFCLVLRYVFEKNTAIMRCIFKSERPFLNIEDHRQRHESICETLEVADNIFSFTIFSFFANYLLLLCLIAFELVALDSGHDMKLIRFFWCLISISTITIICFAAASVNSAVS